MTGPRADPLGFLSGAALLLDQAHPIALRDAIGELLARSREAAFAISRIRLAGIDLGRGEVGGLEGCRVLIGRLDAETLADAGAAARRDPARMEKLRVLMDFIESGHLAVRAAGREAWHPDFSVFRLAAPGAGEPADVAVIGAHYFGRPDPPGGLALTCLLAGGTATAHALSRFDALWSQGYDVLPVVQDALSRLLDGNDDSSPRGG